MSLLGISEENKFERSKYTDKAHYPITIGKDCLSCSKQQSKSLSKIVLNLLNIAVIIKAFKMACLSYQPKDVKYNNESFTRTSLLQVRNLGLNRNR